MAMGGPSQERIRQAIQQHRAFTNSTGSMRGTQGGTRNLGWLSNHPDRTRIKALLRDAVYVVWSYDTPIGWITEDDDGNVQRWYVDEQHSPTTSHHQTLMRVAFSEYDTIGERPRPQRQPQRPQAARSMASARRAEDRQAETRLSVLTDPRYADPEWVPPEFRRDQREILAADQRDWDRVRTGQDRGWTSPAHP